jgi:hypothetical protein
LCITGVLLAASVVRFVWAAPNDNSPQVLTMGSLYLGFLLASAVTLAGLRKLLSEAAKP